jgi:hypothetical protein
LKRNVFRTIAVVVAAEVDTALARGALVDDGLVTRCGCTLDTLPRAR